MTSKISFLKDIFSPTKKILSEIIEISARAYLL